jgi:hypothetical protein
MPGYNSAAGMRSHMANAVSAKIPARPISDFLNAPDVIG